jgi:hypothetical protein
MNRKRWEVARSLDQTFPVRPLPGRRYPPQHLSGPKVIYLAAKIAKAIAPLGFSYSSRRRIITGSEKGAPGDEERPH